MSAVIGQTNEAPFAWPDGITLAQKLTWCDHANRTSLKITPPYMGDNETFGLCAYYEVETPDLTLIVEYGVRPNGERFVVS